jgi:hypothetical protein
LILEVYRSVAARTFGANLVPTLTKLFRNELDLEEKTGQFHPSKWFRYENGKVVIVDDVIKQNVTNLKERLSKKNILIVTRCDKSNIQLKDKTINKM